MSGGRAWGREVAPGKEETTSSDMPGGSAPLGILSSDTEGTAVVGVPSKVSTGEEPLAAGHCWISDGSDAPT